MENVLTRDDTFLGICEALGEDFGFNANWLRLALGVGLLFNPLASFGAYAVAGIVVAATRLIAPNPRRAAEPVESSEAEAVEPEQVEFAYEAPPLAAAA